jgi:hypothetical protein
VKLFNTPDCPTQTYTSSSNVPGSGNTDGYKWHVRVSTHPNVSYEQFKIGLLENHSRNEREYIEDCKTADKIQVIKEGEMEGESRGSESSPELAKSKTDEGLIRFA